MTERYALAMAVNDDDRDEFILVGVIYLRDKVSVLLLCKLLCDANVEF